MVQIPLGTWNEFLDEQEPKPSQKQRILNLIDQWENDPENDMSDEWWDEFDELLNSNRVNSHD